MKIMVMITLAAGVAVFPARSQDFKKVVDIVVKMESSLKTMIAKEEVQRKTEVARLKTEVAELRAALPVGSTVAGHSPDRDTAFGDQIVRRLEALEQGTTEGQRTQELAVLTSQLSTLLAELKNTIDDANQRPGAAATNQDVPQPATAQPVLPSIKVGVLAQVQGQTLQEQSTARQDADPGFNSHWQRQLYVRRMRILVGGDIAKNTSFFVESDAPNIGKVDPNGTKASKVQMYVQDAQVQHVVVPEFGMIAGLQLVGITRNGLQSAATLMALDYGAYQFGTSMPLDNNVGRDLGLNLRGFLADERLEYRIGVFSGRNLNMYSPLRATMRFNYDFKDREKGFFYAGTALGKAEIVSIGGGVDMQGSFHAFALDGFGDMNTGSLGSLTLSAGFSVLDGGGSDDDSTFFTGMIPKQNVAFLEAGYFFKDCSIQPYLKFESQTIGATLPKQVGATSTTLEIQNAIRSSSRFGMGANYYFCGHNANVKLLYEWLTRNRLATDPARYESVTTGQLTIQVQYYAY